MRTKTIVAAATLTALAFASAAIAQEQTVDTRIGKLTFTHDFVNGYPTDETVQKLYDERDFQRAVQAYLWATPLTSMESSRTRPERLPCFTCCSV
jgi:hypothetical protein